MERRYLGVISLGVFALALSACGGGGGGGSTLPQSTPTPTPTSTPTTLPQSATCPTGGSLPTSIGAYSSGSTFDVARRSPARMSGARYVPGSIAVTYEPGARIERTESITGRISGTAPMDLQYSGQNLKTRVITVDPSHTAEAIAQLKAIPGVRSAVQVAYRHRMTVSSDDPYYNGFGPGAPYYEDATTAGQWDMHVINVAGAWNDVSSSAPVKGAPIAIIDTGVDVTHPELTGGKIIRTRCYVTYPSGTAQTSGQYVTDTDGHGTDVAGIADGDTNNTLGFASVGFGAPLLAYRIFPTEPSTGCEGTNPPAQCDANTGDEASAINDAVAHGAKVINLSLGSTGPCSASDPEYVAVENAISHGVVVVAASGNEGNAALDCPAQDPGVIAVGASALDDSVTPIVEKVASYSNWVSGTNSGLYMVAPGGDPSSADSSGTTTDFLHWIENIYSSTAVQKGTCSSDFHSSSVVDCRVLIAGTSMASPHVAGIASLILAVRPSYTPAQVATALCKSADPIGDSKQGCGRVDAAAAVAYAQANP